MGRPPFCLHGLPCSEPAAYPGEPPLGDDARHEGAMSPLFPHLQCLTRSRARVSACLEKALLCMLDPNSCFDVLCDLFCFLSLHGLGGVLFLFHRTV